MSMKGVRESFARTGASERDHGRLALLALIVLTSAACGNNGSTTVPPMAGSILLATETSGFMQDESYDLLVDGESQGTIGANDQTTISELDPATYEVALGDVATNCTVDGTSVEVLPNESTSVTLSVVCSPPAPVSYSIRFSRARPDLDTGTVVECPFSICPSDADWDMYAFDTFGTPRTVIRQNQSIGVEIAHLSGVSLDGLTEQDVASATFTTELVTNGFDAGRVILIKTDLGAIYALGNPVEDTTALTLTFDAVLVVEAP